jgi:hypothetical protein
MSSLTQNFVKKGICLLVLTFALTPLALAQEVEVHGGFLSDSVKIGEETAFYLSAKYPESETVLFPDSSAVYSPFEYQRKKYFPTHTTAGVSYDSALYYLTTFEIDRAQYLSLSVYLVNAQDCTAYSTDRDSLLLIQMVKNLPDTVSVQNLPLQANTDYHKVNFELNYIIGVMAAGLLVFISVIVWLVFGKRISSYLKAKRLQKKHSDFITRYNNIILQLQKVFSSSTTESAVFLWKSYMEQLEAQPYTKLTTRETVTLQKDEHLARNLHAIDMAIYGHGTAVVDSLEYLKQVADHSFTKKMEDVKHGK